MLDSLFSFYRKNITTYRLVFQFMRIRYALLQISFLFLLFSIYVSVFGGYVLVFAQESFLIKTGLVTLVCAALFFALSIWLLNEKGKWILEHQYGMSRITGVWRTTEFETLQADLLKDYLEENHLYTDEKLKLLIEGLENETRKNKYPTLINSSIIISLSVPLWIQYVTFLFKSAKTLEDSNSLLVNGIFFVLVILSLIGFTKWFFGEFQDAFLFGEKAHRKTLIEKLQDARLRYRKQTDKKDENTVAVGTRIIRNNRSFLPKARRRNSR